ncbi:MAG: hypothetical protein V4656_14475, partial [Pseudomonadota bacterium]
MKTARISAVATAAITAFLFGCASDSRAPDARSAAAPASAVEAAGATAMPATIDNFMLADTDYMGHELYRMTDAKVIVI